MTVSMMGVTFNDQYGQGQLKLGYLLVDVVDHVTANGYDGSLWAENFKGRARIATAKPDAVFARVHVQESENADISAEVLAQMNAENHPVVVMALPSGKYSLYYPKSYESGFPYEGRQYTLNQSDCYRLVMDFYKREFGIELRDYKAGNEWLFSLQVYEGRNLLMLNYERENFSQVAAPMYGDPIFICSSDNRRFGPEHVGIYVGDGMMLHHYADRLSCVQPYSSFWKEKTVAILRHNTRL